MDFGRRFRLESDEVFFTERNKRFDGLACHALEDELRRRTTPPPQVAFAYAHSCQQYFRRATCEGLLKVLGQFDPGPSEADIVDQEHADYSEFRTTWRRYSDSYVAAWQEEVSHADKILVNSQWSKSCMIRFGVPVEKLCVVPLMYSGALLPSKRHYPRTFSHHRPLRVLFLGQVILRKGIARLVRAAKLLQLEPIEIRLVGPTDIRNIRELCQGLPVRYCGATPRSDVGRFYDEADVFVLPTLSDGFAMTLLEAQARRLPAITTLRCGEVIKDGVNGIVMEEPTPQQLASSLRRFLAAPELLAAMSEQSCVSGFSLDALASNLTSICARESTNATCAQ